MRRSSPDRRPMAAVVVGLALVAAACSSGGGSDGGSDGGSEGGSDGVTGTTAEAATTLAPGPSSPIANGAVPAPTVPTGASVPPAVPDAVDPDAPDLGRVVALAEEFILADLLTLGVDPVASSATVDTAGFQGLDGFDTTGIEVLPMTTLSLEYLASLQPDTIVTLQFWVDQIGPEALEAMAEVIVVPDGLYGPERLSAIGDLVGRPERAAAAIAEFERALAVAQDRVDDDCTVSLATIYPGPSVAAFVAGPWEIPSSILAAGCALDPDADDAAPDDNGRAWLSLEQLGILDSETLVLLQSETVDGEADAVADIEANPLWQTLPAVANGETIVFDRLGYPGLQGQIRFLDEFGSAMD